MPTSSRADRIRAVLEQGFRPQAISVTDDSARHAGHAGAAPGGETHFDILVVSDVFNGVDRVTRQRLVHTALATEFATGLHALSLVLRTPDEAARNQNV